MKQDKKWVATLSTICAVSSAFSQAPAAKPNGTLVDPSPQTAGKSQKADDLTDLNLDDLSKMQVTTASKKAQSLNAVAAAIFVVTAEDIKRTGAKNVPEALRMVPGVQVSRLGGQTYAVSVRGFNSYNSNKLLVLVDGRTIYSPYISGTYWEVTDMLMENIERIEVIRGPGGSLWGANAVDGIINIITKHSKDTQGGLFITSAGSLESNRLAFRYGGKIGDGTYRVDGKAGVNKDAQLSDGARAGDGENLSELGFRADFDEKSKGRFMFQGSENRFGLYEQTSAALPVAPYSTFFGGMEMITASHILGRWEHDEAHGAQTAVQVYYNMLDYPFSYQGLSGYTWDLDIQHQMAEMKNQSITLGVGARYEINNTWKGIAGWLYPADQRDTILSAFGQDEITINPKNHVTLGLKYEHNSVTGSEFQPNARYAYTPDENHTIWASVARAVRKPGQFDEGQVDVLSAAPPATQGGLPTASVFYGNQGLTSEKLIANEIGYRTKPMEHVLVDVAAYYNIYDNLLYYAGGTPFTGTILGGDTGSTYPLNGQQYEITPTYTYNGDKGHTYGLEWATHYNPSKLFHATLGYTYMNWDGFALGTTMFTPKNSVDLHLSWDLPHELKFDTMAHWYDAIFDEGVSAYVKLDANLSWKPTTAYEVSVGGNDLLSNRHREGTGIFWPTAEIPRSYYAKVTLHF